ncbi:hypothetical protein CSPAE12_07163 [Colletotrichum incanum]|nr:hypothetical protein CSPAE12_07163 [Colletotrichum incanum]
MGTTGQGPPTQQQYAHAPYPPQQQQYYAQQQPTPPGQRSQQSQLQYQQYQQYYQPYQPPQQPQYYHPPQQQQYASPPPPAAASQPPPPVAPPSQQQHFFAELEAPQSTTPAAKPRPTSTSTSSPSTTAAQTQHGVPGTGTGTGPVVFEMPAEAPAPKPDDASKSQRIASVSSAADQANQKLPAIQANPWGFFLPDDLPERVDSTSPTKESLADDQMLSVKPLRIVKTGPAEEKPESRPQSDVLEDVAPQPLRPSPETGAVAGVGGPPQTGGSPDTAPLAPAPLNIARPQSPAAQHQPPPPTSPVSAVQSASQLPYPIDGASIPTPDSHPMPQPGAQITLPIHPAATGSSPNPASPTTFAPSPLTPLQTGTTAPQPQHYHVLPQQACTQASPVSPIIVQAGLPPTLPVGSYFPQQPSYARPQGAQPPQAPPSAHHSPAPSISSTTQAGPQPGQHSPAQPYTSPPPSYNQAVTQGQPTATSPNSLTQFHRPPAPAQPLSPNPTGIPLPMSPPPSQYPYSPSCIGADKIGFHHQPPPTPQQHFHNQHASPPIPQPSYVNGPQYYQPVPPPLPPRTSPPTPGQYGYAAPSPYGPPPTRPNYQAPPAKPDSRLFSSATARKLLNKTTELMDQTITPYLQDHRYRPPYNGHQYQYQYQYPNRPASGLQGQYYQQGHAPSQRT